MRDSKGPITSSALMKMMKKFEATSSLTARQRSGRPSTAAAVATAVEQAGQSMSAVAAHGECSAREVSMQTGVSYGSVWKALRITLKRYPYKLQHKQELKPPDFDSRRVLGVKETENDEPRPLKGWWTVLCDPENENSEGLTELDIASTVLKELCDRERSLFTSPLSFKSLDIGTTSISCYTVDSEDVDSILKSAKAIRECFHYPYAMYYFTSRTVSQYMHTPNGEFYRKVDRSWALVSFEPILNFR
ncbi:transposable element tc3 transposase [Caerostris extrusa]|uniref:Transposable element tc3 transposase n=1 Tax=Caerostris extrusa TaxID=172846 RepID=A0AAV4Y1Q2_CAEEX|nr:transposable element tc3 transposase [Caerostris extrusa]